MTAVLVMITLVNVPVPAAATSAAMLPACGAPEGDRNEIRVSPSHGSVFYIDSGQGQNIDAAYVAYRVQNLSGTTARPNLWVSVDNFTGGVVQLSNPADRNQPLGELATSETDTAFFLLKALASTTKAQSHVVRVHSGKPGTTGATELYNCTFTFAKVAETIKAAANKVTSSVATTAVSTVGSTMTVTVQGTTGTVGAGSPVDGSMIWVTPAARSSWPTGALRLESTSFDLFSNPSRQAVQRIAGSPFVDQLRIDMTKGARLYYTAVYTFRVIGVAPAPDTPVLPIAQIASGTQIKHTDLGSLAGATLDASTPTVGATVTKAVAPNLAGSGGVATLDYTVTLTNTGPEIALDEVTDVADASLDFVAGSANFGGTQVPDPTESATQPGSLTFSGPLTVPAGTAGAPASRTLTYSMSTACDSTLNVTNRATARIGSLTIGSGPATASVSTASGSATTVDGQCSGTLESHTVDQQLPIEVTTGTASGISTTAATVSASVDPNEHAGENIVFEWGSDPDLVGATATIAGQTSGSPTPYGVSQGLTGLESGSTYYYRVVVGGAMGEVLSFTTTEPPGMPMVQTIAPTNVTDVGTATLNGLVDPNQVPNGAKVKFEYAADSSGGSCTGLPTGTTTGFLTSETESGTEVAIFTGAFPTEVAYDVSGLVTGSRYCYRAIAFYEATSATWATSTAGEWLPFLAVTKAAQTISFSTPGAIKAGTTTTAEAGASSGLPVQYSSNTPEVCTASESGGITGLAVGTCSVTASQPGDDAWEAAAPVTATFEVTKGTQTIAFPAPANVNPESTVQANAVASSGLPVTYTSNTPATCSIDAAGVVTGIASGECSITASQAGSEDFDAAADATVSMLVKAEQAIDFASPESIAVGETSVATATASSGLAVTYTSETPAICTVDGDGTITSIAAGTCRITADQAGSDTYAPAAPVTVAFVITPGPPSITTTVVADGLANSAYEATLQAEGGDGVYSGWTISAGSLPDGLSLDASTGVISGTPSTAGTVTVAVTVMSYGYTSEPRTFQLTIALRAQTITAADVTVTYGDDPFAGSATTSSGLPVTYEVADPAVATVRDGAFTVLAAGETTVTATAAGNGAYAAADPVTFTLRVNKADLVVTAPSPTVTYGDAVPALIPAYTGFVPGDNEEALAATPVCTTEYSPSTGAGQAPAVECSGGAAADYDITYAAGVFTVEKAPQTIAFTPVTSEHLHTAERRPFSATSTSGDEVRIVASGVCTWEGEMITASTDVGMCTLTASVAESTNFLAAAEQVRTFSVSKRERGLGLAVSSSAITAGSTVHLVGSPTAGGGSVSYSVARGSGVCSINGSVLTGLAVGTCEVRSTISADDLYASATSGIRVISVTSVRSMLPDGGSGPVGGSNRATGPLNDPGEPTPDSGDGGRDDGASSPAEEPIDTVDSGRSDAGSAPRSVRTSELPSQRFSGFAPGTGIRIGVTGARSVGQFVATPGFMDSIGLTAALNESRSRLASDFAWISQFSVSAHAGPSIAGDATADMLETFAESGLAAPVTAGTIWEDATLAVQFEVAVEEYVPGSVVYLAVTSDPVVFGSAVVGQSGAATIIGALPHQLLEVGAHNIRVVGERQLTGAFADSNGELTLTTEAIAEIERFDAGSVATVRVLGTNESGGVHEIVREVPLDKSAPWWTILLLLGAIVIAIALRAFFGAWSRTARVLASVALIALTALPTALGWMTSSYGVVVWGLALGALAQVTVWAVLRLGLAGDDSERSRHRRSAMVA